MITVEVPKDVRRYEAKLIGPLTTRNTAGAAIAVVSAIIVNRLLTFLGVAPDMTTLFCIVAAIPGIGIGWLKPYEQPLEQFLISIYYTEILSPPIRKYVSENEYEECIPVQKLNKKKKKKKKTEMESFM